MLLEYIKANPSGNTTVLVVTSIPRDLYAPVARVIMSKEYLAAEQVGYIVHSNDANHRIRMEMMAGEFCGNASRCYAAWLVSKHDKIKQMGRISPNQYSIMLDVSGHEKTLKASVEVIDNHRFYVTLKMPLPSNIKNGYHDVLGSFCIVSFDGITHVILWDRKPNVEDIAVVRTYLQENSFTVNALGIMFFDKQTNILTPVVSIEGVRSIVWESSCGSGSTAVAAALTYGDKCGVNKTLHQPGGDLAVKSVWADDKLQAIYLSGRIDFTSAGTLFIDDRMLYNFKQEE